MVSEELKSIIIELEPGVVFDETGEWLNMSVDVSKWKTFAQELRIANGCNFDFLFCLTCIDWKTQLEMVYHLTSTTRRHTIVVKVKLDSDNPEIATVSDIWRTAEMHELEVYDLFGVKFLHHPGLRRLMLTDDWVGWPLRKDYEDPVNMIKL
jgi:NADH-quinone oxidoreductase subunit C